MTTTTETSRVRRRCTHTSEFAGAESGGHINSSLIKPSFVQRQQIEITHKLEPLPVIIFCFVMLMCQILQLQPFGLMGTRGLYSHQLG